MRDEAAAGMLSRESDLEAEQGEQLPAEAPSSRSKPSCLCRRLTEPERPALNPPRLVVPYQERPTPLIAEHAPSAETGHHQHFGLSGQRLATQTPDPAPKAVLCRHWPMGVPSCIVRGPPSARAARRQRQW
jgi:hypothetical protein